MGSCLYRHSDQQYKYNNNDIYLKQQLIQERIETLNKLQEEREQMQQRYQKNIEEGEKMRPPKKLNQSAIEQSGFDISLSKNLQNLEYIQEAEDESSMLELEKPMTTERRMGDDEGFAEDGLLLQLTSAKQLDNDFREQLQGRETNEMDDEILQYFNTTAAKYDEQKQ